MKKVNKIFKNRLTDKLNIKARYSICKVNVLTIKNSSKVIYNLDDILYVLYDESLNSGQVIVKHYKNNKLHIYVDKPSYIIYDVNRKYLKME